jgi:hypothetical protein
MFQGNRYLNWFFGVPIILALDYLQEKILQALSSGKATLVADAKGAGIYSSAQDHRYPIREWDIRVHRLLELFYRNKAQFAPGHRLRRGGIREFRYYCSSPQQPSRFP